LHQWHIRVSLHVGQVVPHFRRPSNTDGRILHEVIKKGKNAFEKSHSQYMQPSWGPDHILHLQLLIRSKLKNATHVAQRHIVPLNHVAKQKALHLHRMADAKVDFNLQS
jgi:hypothetical protein